MENAFFCKKHIRKSDIIQNNLCMLTFILIYSIIKEDVFDWKSEQEELYEKEMAFRRGGSRT